MKITQFMAFQKRINHLKQVKPNFLVVVGEESTEENEVIKIYNLDKIDSKTEEFQLVKSYQIFPKNTKIQPSPITCLDVSQDFSCLALGLGNGNIILYQGDLARGKANVKVFGSKDGLYINGLAFRRVDSGYSLFYATTNSTYVLNIYKTIEQVEIDKSGCDVGCFTTSHEGDLVLGRKDGIFTLNQDGKLNSYSFEGKKISIQWFRTYLVVLSSELNKKNNIEQIVTIYDLANKYIALKFASEKSLNMILIQEWGVLYAIIQEKVQDGKSQKMFQLVEKDTQTKLNHLFQKKQYQLAIELVKSQQLDYAYVVDSFCKFGDHLYSEKKFDEAMKQYLETIGHLEPSYVIRKYLDAQRIHNLTHYLETLHEKKLATANHTTLLLNCYTKLKDEKKEKLDNFIKNNSQLNYDVETAIKVFRQVGYIQHALTLAKKHEEHEWFLKIQIEDLQKEEEGSKKKKNYKKALKHIESLEYSKVEKYTKLYGKVLVSQLPKQTTNLMIRLCTNYLPTPPKEKNRSVRMEGSGRQAKTEDFIHCFSNSSECLLVFLENVIQRKPQQQTIVYNTLIELYLKFMDSTKPIDIDTEKDEKYNYDIPPVDETFTKLTFKEKILFLIDHSDSNYDTEHVLVLVQSYGFREGILKMYEKLSLHYDIVQYYMEVKDHENLIQSCIKYGSNDPNMWIQVLSYFANENEPYEKEILQILSKIEKDDILPPLLVIQILSKQKTSLGVIKDYLAVKLKSEQLVINEDLEKIKEHQTETNRMRAEIEQLKTSAKIFQLAACSFCNNTLELPAVHFMCGHSFHQRCLNDLDECSQCQKKNKEILQLKKRFEESLDQHELFFKELKRKPNEGFSVVSEYFGRGIFKSQMNDDQSHLEGGSRRELFDE